IWATIIIGRQSSTGPNFGEDVSRLVERLTKYFNFPVELVRVATGAPFVGGTIGCFDGFNCHFEVLYGLSARFVEFSVGLYQIKVEETCIRRTNVECIVLRFQNGFQEKRFCKSIRNITADSIGATAAGGKVFQTMHNVGLSFRFNYVFYLWSYLEATLLLGWRTTVVQKTCCLIGV
ncbi:AAEL004192-PA, partial [Aedes aegypti]